MFRRLLLAAFLSFVANWSTAQSCGIIAVLLASLLLQFNVQPFPSKIENALEEIGLIIITFSYGTQQSAQYYNSFDTLSLVLLVVITNGLTILAMTFWLVRATVINFRKKRAKLNAPF
jgi:hypothetical protein